MNLSLIYPEGLIKLIHKKKLIPRRIKDKEKLKIYHRYWLPEYGGEVKVINVEYIWGQYYYFITFGADMKMNACISSPVASEACYELLHNKENIESINIINSENSYTGAEIIYWFIYNKIDLKCKKYKGYWSFLNPNSNNRVVDNKYYFVKSKDKKNYMELDKSKL